VIFPEKVQKTSVPSDESIAFTFHPEYLVTLKPNFERSYTKTGMTLLQLANNTSKDISVSLVAQDFSSNTTNQPLGAKVSFTLQPEVPGKPVFPQTLKPGQVLILKVDVGNVWEAGESTADLFANGTRIGALTAINYRFGFNVKLDSPTDKPEM